jgi:hypothetical protein
MIGNLNIDMMARGGMVQGQVASKIAANGSLNVGSMRPYINKFGQTVVTVYVGGDPQDKKNYQTYQVNANAAGTLRRDEWKQLDEAVLIASRYRLGGVQDLIDHNCVYNLGNAMGTTVLEWHDVNDAMEATLTMDGVTRGNADRPQYQYNYLPIPIIHVDYEINARELAMSRNMGNPFDVSDAEMAARRIAEKLETMLFTNTTYAFGQTDSRSQNKIYSYVNHPDRNMVRMSIPWSNSGMTGPMILQDVQDMKQALVNARHFGPYVLYIPTGYERVLDSDYLTTTIAGGTTLTIGERILRLKNIESIKVIDTLPANNVLLVQMTTDVVRLVRGLGISNVEWMTEGNFLSKYKVLTIQVPQIRSDQNRRSGVCHLA